MGDHVRRQWPPPVRCGAMARHTGQPCKRWAVPGSDKCTNHGAYAGPNGRAHTEDLHKARRTEALVTAQVGKAMEAAGFPAALIEAAAAGTLDIPAFRPSQAREEADEEAALVAGMSALTAKAVAAFQAVAARVTEPAERSAPVGARRPFTLPVLDDLSMLDGEVVEQPPVTTSPDRDRVAEDIERLEARPTGQRAAEAARLRRQRELVEAVTDRHTEPESDATSPPPEPAAAPQPPRPGRRITTLGTTRGGLVNLPGGHP